MSKQLKIVKLSQIKLETKYRQREKDLSLELDLSRNGLKEPLIVEAVNKNLYILVDGYRRYYALDFLEIEEACCIVEEQTSKEHRIIKRLGRELQTKKRTAYELERMIKDLLRHKDYNSMIISQLCGVSEETINKYLLGSDVNPEWLRRGATTGAGRHGFTVIHHLNVSDDIKGKIAERYINREFPKTTLDVINKITKEKGFNSLSEEYVEACINDIILHQASSYQGAKYIVDEYALKLRFSKSNHASIHDLVFKLLMRIEAFFNNKHYVNHLTNKQRARLIIQLHKLLSKIRPHINWADVHAEELKRRSKK
ncbi:ParB/RepB/Spo0J family partition protein [Piscibacillus sp. B03]|uniref:ParB/RepB/Spo0J family partition protein n=1 Tax=Piscibacillus sp. B03 TaxID=3457430 RepID=UPI003FCCE152